MSTQPHDEALHPREQQGGRFATKPVSEAAGGMDAFSAPASAPEAAEGVARGELAAVLNLWGLESVPDALDGRTYEQVWDEAMADTQLPAEPLTADQAIYAELGDDFNIGRHRSGPDLVWRDLSKSDDADDQWLIVGPDDAEWYDPAFELAASFYTRNGGGNRECSCNFGSDCICTASVIEDLQDHPAHLHDQDDDFDASYASFRFKMPKDAMRDVLSANKVAQRRTRACRLLASIEVGKVTPWSIMPENPETKLALEGANDRRAQASRASQKFNGSGTGLNSHHNVKPEHLRDIEALEAWVSGGSDQAPATTANWGYSGAMGRAVKGEYEVRASQQAATTIALVAADKEAGLLPDHVLQLLEDGLKSSAGIRYRAAKLADNVASRDRMMSEIGETKGKVAAVLAAREVEAAALAEVATLTRALTWPDAAQTCPPELANASGADDLLGW